MPGFGGVPPGKLQYLIHRYRRGGGLLFLLPAAGRDVTLLTIPDAPHAQGYFEDPTGYQRALDTFSRRVLEE